MVLYWWDSRDGPDLSGWWFGVEKGSDVVWAYASTDSRYPAHTAWPVPHNGPVDETITLSWTSTTIPEEDVEVRWSGNDENNVVGQVSQSKDATSASGAGEYVEWRRMLPFDDITDGAANHDTFLRLCARLGLYSDVRTLLRSTFSCAKESYSGGCEFQKGKQIKGCPSPQSPLSFAPNS